MEAKRRISRTQRHIGDNPVTEHGMGARHIGRMPKRPRRGHTGRGGYELFPAPAGAARVTLWTLDE